MALVEFRDGKREIPDHLADMMATLPTHTMTHAQAIEKANWKLAQDFLGHVQEQTIQGHFRNLKGGG